MKFGLAVETDLALNYKANIVDALSQEIENYFLDKEYGPDIKDIAIGVIILNPLQPGFEDFFKVRKPKYTRGPKVLNYDGILFTLEKTLEYDIKPDIESFKKASDNEARKILAEAILQSLNQLDDMKKKLKNFDFERFQFDLEQFFKERGII